MIFKFPQSRVLCPYCRSKNIEPNVYGGRLYVVNYEFKFKHEHLCCDCEKYFYMELKIVAKSRKVTRYKAK